VQNAKASGTMVTCGDGTMSKAGRGACSRHKGVQIGPMATPTNPMAAAPATMPAPVTRAAAPTPAARATPTTPAMPAAPMKASSHRGEDTDPTGALAQCKDGMYSHAANRRGACSRHKGVAKWMQP
jgi:hypothetical protein